MWHSVANIYGEETMWVVGEMLRSMTSGPSYVPREGVCTQQEHPQQVQVKYEAQRNEEVSYLKLNFVRKVTFGVIGLRHS